MVWPGSEGGTAQLIDHALRGAHGVLHAGGVEGDAVGGALEAIVGAGSKAVGVVRGAGEVADVQENLVDAAKGAGLGVEAV